MMKLRCRVCYRLIANDRFSDLSDLSDWSDVLRIGTDTYGVNGELAPRNRCKR